MRTAPSNFRSNFRSDFRSNLKWPLLIAVALLASACSPKIYVIDRQTALEEEAAGQWPQFEKQLLRRSASGEPVPFGKVPVTARQQRLYNVLNGEMASTETAAAPAAADGGAKR